MDTSRFRPGQWLNRTTVALGAAALIVTGAALQMDAHPTLAAQTAAARAPSQTNRVIAGGRDSYADIVKLVAPSVVTIRVEGRSRVAPAQFQLPDNDFFRRFFGDPEDQQGPTQRTPP